MSNFLGPMPPTMQPDVDAAVGSFSGEVQGPKIVVGINKSTIVSKFVNTISSYTTGGTLTPSDIVNGLVTLTSSGGSYTFPSASSFISFLGTLGVSPIVGDSFDVTLVNTSAGTATVNPGTGNTLSPASPFVIVATYSQTFKFVITDVITPAVHIYLM